MRINITNGALILSLVLFSLIYISNGQNITTKEFGTLIGSLGKTSWTSETIYQFMGIRFAETPSGKRRFKAPVLAVPWPGVHDAQKPGRPCPSLDYIKHLSPTELMGDLEDCLHLSIYTKNLTAKYPVMFYVHGGSFETGNAFEHPPNYLLNKNIVLVVTQYRLGPFGFLSTNTKDIPGNAGVLDVIAALNWTKSFIHYFGGDPDQITIFGQSAGAVIISSLMLSPSLPKNLFQRAIIQSGSVFAKWASGADLLDGAMNLAKSANCNVQSIETVNKCLLEYKVVPLLMAHQKIWRVEGTSQVKFGGLYNDILPMSERKAYDGYNILKKNVSLMAGTTKHDGSYTFAMAYDIALKFGFDLIKDHSFNTYNMTDYLIRVLAATDYSGSFEAFVYGNIFTHDQIVRGNFSEMLPGFIDISGVSSIKAPTFKIAKIHAKYFPKKTWLYSFDYAGQFTRFGYNGGTSHYPFDGGVHHGNDNIYLFPWPESASMLNAEDTIIAKRMVELWTSFAIHGEPKAHDVPKWPTVTRYSGPYMHINRVCKIDEDYLNEFSVASREARNGKEKFESSFHVLVLILFKINLLSYILNLNNFFM